MKAGAQRGDCDNGNPVSEDPNTVAAVGIRVGMRPIGKNGGDRTRDAVVQSGRAYGEAGTSVPREKVWSEPPSRLA